MKKIFGYARVSTRDQNEARQVQALLGVGVPERDIFVDKQSGKDFARPQYQAMLVQLRPGDEVILPSIDRLGRDYTAIMEQWRHITQTAGCGIRVLDMPLLDTTRAADGLEGKFIAELVLQILSYVAEKERQGILARQRQGIEAARKQGKHLGRPELGIPEGYAEVMGQWRAGEITAVAAMKRLGMKKTRFYRLAEGDAGALPQNPPGT